MVSTREELTVSFSDSPGAASTSDDEPPTSDENEECQTNRDQPHLRFEITSDDGFSVEADSIEGK